MTGAGSIRFSLPLAAFAAMKRDSSNIYLIEPRGIVAEDFLLCRYGDSRHLADHAHRMRPFAVAVRIIRTVDQAAVAQFVDHMRNMILARFAAEKNPPVAYQLRRRRVSRFSVLQMFIQTAHPIGRPAATRFEEGKTDFRVFLEHIAVEKG